MSTREISTNEKTAMLYNIATDDWRWAGTTTPWTPVENIYNTTNSISPIAEANSTTGVVGSTGTPTITSVASPKTNGSYAIQITTTGESIVVINRPSGFLTGVAYTVNLDISYTGAETGIQFYTSTSDEWNAVSDNVDVLNGNYTTYTLPAITCTSIEDSYSGRLRIYIPTAQTLYIDNIVWKED
jgi:hypothetical protein